MRQLKALLTESIEYMRRRLALLWGGLLLLCFLFSLGFFLADGRKEENRVFIFPSVRTGELAGETRRMRNTGLQEERIRAYLEDMVLGPLALNLARLLPESTKVNSVLLRGDRLYVDFSREMLFLEEEETPLPFDRILPIIEQSVKFNFRRVKEVIVTIDGQEPQKKNKSR